MITIVAEKYDVAGKIAAALDKITLKSGKVVTFKDLAKNEVAVKKQLKEDGGVKIKFEGQECMVTFGYGHLCELKQAKDYNPEYNKWSNLPCPFIPESYDIQLKQMPKDKDKYGYNKKIKNQFAIIKKYMNASDYVINATDDDREGEVIFSYIYQLANCKKPIKRVCFSAQTQKGIQTAFKHLVPGSERHNIELAGRTRSIADWLVGSNLTAFTTLQLGAGDILSIGRVQTPTLKMIVDRTLAIKSFKSEKYYTVSAIFTTKSGKTYKGEHTQKRFDKKSDAENVLNDVNGQTGTVTEIKKTSTKKEVPLLYSLPALQMEANSKFGLTLKETLDTVQWLYENHLVTYPRTNSQYLTEDMEFVVNAVLDKLSSLPEYNSLISGKDRVFDKPHFFNDKKVESHFAIIPTGELPIGKLSPTQSKIYDLICRSVIRMLYSPAILEKTSVTTTVYGVDTHEFKSNGTTIVDPQWFLVSGTSKETILPPLSEGETVSGEYSLNEKDTEPPKAYTEKTILSAMITAGKDLEDAELKKILSDPSVEGIGTAATRDSIIETLITRGYVKRSGKTLTATEKGISLISCFPVNDVKSPELTAKWEQRFAKIEKGEDTQEAFLNDLHEAVTKWCGEITSLSSTSKAKFTTTSSSSKNLIDIKCPVCHKPMKSYAWGWGCSGYSKEGGCSFSISNKFASKKISDAQIKKLLTKGKTDLIKGFKSKKGKNFDAYLSLTPENKVVFEFKN